jgi:hypothetical protein
MRNGTDMFFFFVFFPNACGLSLKRRTGNRETEREKPESLKPGMRKAGILKPEIKKPESLKYGIITVINNLLI